MIEPSEETYSLELTNSPWREVEYKVCAEMLRMEDLSDYRKQEYIARIINMILADTRRVVKDLVIENDKIRLFVTEEQYGRDGIHEIFIDECGNINCYD
jgi:hypothetical protein